MRSHEIVVSKVKGNCRFKVFQLLAESISKSRQTAHVQARRAVQSFNVAC